MSTPIISHPTISEFEDGSSIAIIGLSGRFPKARNLDEFWANLRAGVEGIEQYSEEALLKAGVDPAVLADPNYVRAGALIADTDLFDAKFFEMTGSEAAITDPQHRLFLEVAWEALEMAGYCTKNHDGLVGVYAGASFSRYFFQCILRNRQLVDSFGPMQLMIGSDKDSLCTTLSYKLNLRGPSVTVQTACSTSLVAVHMAVQALLNGECDIALAGGVAIRGFSEEGYPWVQGDISSPDGHCRAFDASAAGTVSGNGLGLVVLKKLDRALADGDTIHAVIRGSAINNDGAQKVGFTAPSVNGQMDVIAEALAASGVSPEEVSYVEAHGTGTVLGDPIELTALSHAYANDEARPGACAIGAVKTNIGHLDAAAGVASLIKVTLALKHREIPPTLHFQAPNPNFDLAASPFYINTALKAWTSEQPRRIAGVSSFGIGGTNAHVIVEEAPAGPEAQASRWPVTLLVSGKTAGARLAALERMKDFLAANPGISLADAAFTTQVGREGFAFRDSVVCESIDDAILQLTAAAQARREARPADNAKKPSVVFMFPGQGTQYVNMARSLYEREAAFAAELDCCMDLFARVHQLDLRRAIFPSAAAQDDAAVLIDDMHMAQPALFAVEYAMARYLQGLGVEAAAMVGHSIGEYVAACLAGVFSLADAVMLVGERGRLLAKSPAGAMMVVHADEERLATMLGDSLWIAAINSASSCTVSGTQEAMARLALECEALEIDTQQLRVNRAGHSGLLREVAEEFRVCLARVSFKAPAVPLMSNVTGVWLQAREATDPQYWIDHLLKPVRFAGCVQSLMQEDERLWVEVGPGKALSSLVRFNFPVDRKPSTWTTLPDLQLRDEPHVLVARVLGRLWENGAGIRWQDLYAGERRRRIPLPTYPFQRERYWVEPTDAQEAFPAPASADDRVADLSQWFYSPSWRREDVAPAGWPAPARTRPVLVLGSESPELSSLMASMAALGVRVLLVEKGDTLSLGTSDRFSINPADPDHYRELFTHLQKAGIFPSSLLHLWSLSSQEGATNVDAEIAQYHELLGLAQVLGEAGGGEKIALTVVGSGAFAILGNEPLQPGQALIAAACRVIPLEYKNLDVRYLDVVPEDLGHPDGRLAGRVSKDILAIHGERMIGYRGTYRWVEEVRAVMPAADAPALPLRDGGVVLVTGGLGGVGLLFADYVASNAKSPTLVLTGRGALPEPSDWDGHLLAHDDDDAISAKILALRALEKRGARVRYLSADIAVAEDVERVAKAVSTLGPLSGIFHAAGVGDMSLLHFRSRELGERVLAPKVRGTLQLEKNFAFDKLDFVFLCSSLNALRPTLGQADYCAANSFLDAFAQARRALDGANVVSHNWGPWHEVGMTRSVTPGDAVQHAAGASLTGIKAEDAATVFALLGKLALPQVVVSPYRFARIERFIAATNAGMVGTDDPAVPRPADSAAGALLTARMNDAAAPIEARLLALWQLLFGSATVGPDDNFFAIGGHSLLAVQMASRVRDLFQINLGLHNIFEAPTTALLARRIEAAVAEKAQAKSQSRKETLSKLDGMSREELLKLLEEKRRAKMAID